MLTRFDGSSGLAWIVRTLESLQKMHPRRACKRDRIAMEPLDDNTT